MAVSSYLELMKLRIAALLLFVAATGYLTTRGWDVDPFDFSILLIAGLLASGGASAINHYIDRDLDSAMDRTRGRPLPQHRIEPPSRALAFGLVLEVIALSAAAILVNVLTAAMILLGLVVYVGVYTLGLKRTHASNIVIGGLAGSCPALAGSAAAIDAISLPAVLIGVLVFLWTPGHFWALAYRLRDDYRRVGIPMLPAVRDEGTSVRAIAVSTGLVPLSTFAFFLAPTFHNGLYLTICAAAAAALFVVTARFVRRPAPDTALSGYRFSGTYLAAILGAMIASAIWFAPG